MQGDTLLQEAASALAQGRHDDPFTVLGMHKRNGKWQITAFLPEAESVKAITTSGTTIAHLKRISGSDLFVADTNLKEPTEYRLSVQWMVGKSVFADAYAFESQLGDMDVYLLAEGTHQALHRVLGAHPTKVGKVSGVKFAVWAPNASRVSVVGDFCGWDGRRLPMRRIYGCGVWDIFVPHLTAGLAYKYEIVGADGSLLPLKADPVGQQAEMPPRTASVVSGIDFSKWKDGDWASRRERINDREMPISIYEVHLGSWRRVPEEGNRYLTYDELAENLIPYVCEMGFTHIELLPITEYPFDGSWGYQPIGLFAPTSRYGSPEDFARFVRHCHDAGLSVWVDWVGAHFPNDPHGLGYFDGSHLYEHADPRQGFHRDWNTLIYNYGRREVRNYLLNSALFWLREYQIDGLRADAVASMLYLDYSRDPGEWVPNVYGGRENLEALAFLRQLNSDLYREVPGCATAAEESTAWPGVSRPVYDGGLGFGFKWNMGWMHDTLEYFQHETIHRSWHHHKLTFGLLYAFSENFILPLSHDEVVHGKGSLLSKMPGDDWQAFANLRAYYGFMYGHPGKKLLFMGGEFGQRSEWNHDQSLEWHLLQYPSHAGIQRVLRDLNHTYRNCPALYELDCESGGFEWVISEDAPSSVLAFIRKGKSGAAPILVICNFTPVPRENYRVGVPVGDVWREIINTDSDYYGGSNMGNTGGVTAETVASHGRPFSLVLQLPPLATVFLQPGHCG